MTMSYKSSNPEPLDDRTAVQPNQIEPSATDIQSDDQVMANQIPHLPRRALEEPVTRVVQPRLSRRLLFGTAAAVGVGVGASTVAWRLATPGGRVESASSHSAKQGESTATPPPSTLSLDTQRGTVRVESVGAGTIRITILDEPTTALRFSYAVNKDMGALPATVDTQTDEPTLRTEEMAVTIHPQTGAISAWTEAGVFLEETDHGFLKVGDGYRWQLVLPKSETSHGLGQRAFPLSLRDKRLELWNYDARSYYPGDDPLYLSIPFYLGHRPGLNYGIFWDSPARAWIDMDSDNNGLLTYQSESRPAVIYLITAPDPQLVVQRFAQLTGTMELPPLWALGYHQTRWSYKDEAHYRAIAKRMRAENIPCDALHFDIDYMDGFRVFTWDYDKFPDPHQLLTDLSKDGFKSVAIVDPGIKVDAHYPAYQEAKEKGLFLTDPSGEIVTDEAWAGISAFPDFTRKTTRDWWADQISAFAKVGFMGIWNDMNEPSTFQESRSLPDDTVHHWEGEGNTHSGGGNGVYGMQMARATRDGLIDAYPDNRPFVMSRAGYAGLQRFSTTWNGDSRATWEHLRITIPQMLNLGMSGVPFTGSDAGGFRGDPDAELYLRWMQLASMTPLFRTHSSRTSKERNPWSYGTKSTDRIREIIERRYRLMPYFYTLLQRACADGTPLTRPMFFEHPEDPDYQRLDDQFMLGDQMLVAPILEQGARSKSVVLPVGDWYRYEKNPLLEGGRTITDPVGMGLPLFVRAGSVVPHWPVRQSTAEPVDALSLAIYAGSAVSQLYEDAGDGYGYRAGDYRASTFATSQDSEKLTASWTMEGGYQPAYEQVEVRIYGLAKAPTAILTDGREVHGERVDGTSTFTTSGFRKLEILL